MKKHRNLRGGYSLILSSFLILFLSICFGFSVRAEDTFTDVAAASPYHDAIYWALDNGVTTGKTDTTFAPDAGCTRGQFVTFLWRAVGSPEPAGSVTFSDMVAPGSPFYKAIQWAAEEGITQGYAGNLFKPSEVCSRGSALTFLYRAAGEPAVSAQNISFTDMVPESHAYYKGIVWGVANGITLGYSDGTFKPFRACSRGQNVTFLYRAKDQLQIGGSQECSHTMEIVSVTEPSCTMDGITTYRCTKCGYEETSVSPALGHTEGDWEVEKEATCMHSGDRVRKCTRCGLQTDWELIPMLDHDYEASSVIEPTCTTPGYQVYTCRRCGMTTMEVNASIKDHDWRVSDEKKATCTEAGYTEYVCANDPSHTKREDYPAYGHAESGWKTVKNATCTEKGEEETECLRCGQVLETREVPALGHIRDNWQTVKAADCMHAGEKQEVCPRCKEVLQTAKIPSAGQHHYNIADAKSPTCTEDGYIHYVCSICGAERTDSLDAVGHSWKEVTKEADCEEDGYTGRTCERCGATEKETVIPALGHDWKLEKETEADCGHPATKTEKCARCGREQVTETAPATGEHNWQVVSETEPTCTKAGVKTEQCIKCGETKTTETAPATGHDYEWIFEEEPTDTEMGYRVYKCKNCGNWVNNQIVPAGFNRLKEYTIDIGNGETDTVWGFFNETYTSQMLDAINEYRRENGVAELQPVDWVEETARIRAPEIAYYFSHTRPNGDISGSASPTGWLSGENIGEGYGTLDDVMEGWKNSPGHDFTMLDSYLTGFGGACFIKADRDANGIYHFTTYWVQDFS